MKKLTVTIILYLLTTPLLFSQLVSEDTETCIDCHQSVTPGIVSDWKTSLHASSSVGAALSKSELERRVSIDPESELAGETNSIGCYECHSLNTDNHKDSFDHFGYTINIVVSPNDCSTCHPVEVEQYSHSKKAFAHDILSKNEVYTTLVNSITETKDYSSGTFITHGSNETTLGETCYACHGTVVNVNGMQTIDSDFGELDVPVLTNWPNQGVGRINPDGSKGACTACHPRHSFSIEVAREPYTCGQCHLEPDVPAYNVYKESKHGNIFTSLSGKFNMNKVPWTVGKDFTAPTCAVCHNSLVVDGDENILAERSHDFGARLWVRIFGLPYSHPQPKSGETYNIRNSDGLQLATNFTGSPSSEFLLTQAEQEDRRNLMSNVCKSCHSTSWVNNQLDKLDKVNSESDAMVLSATKILLDGWEKGVADNKNPFDENIEQLWVAQWLFYANSVRYGTAMMGPDYATFKNGWWNMSHNLQKMHDIVNSARKK